MSQTCLGNQVESVKAIRYQAKKIRDSLLQLAKVSEDRPKIKQWSHMLSDIWNLKFWIFIRYDYLFCVNLISNSLQ